MVVIPTITQHIQGTLRVVVCVCVCVARILVGLATQQPTFRMFYYTS